MKNRFLLLSVAAVVLAGCQSSRTDEQAGTYGACAPDSPTIRTITDAQGTLTYSAQTKEYQIAVAQPGTIDVVDVGTVCGDLPTTWQKEGVRKVTFSGKYKAYENAPAAPAGTTLYRLELTKLTAQ